MPTDITNNAADFSRLLSDLSVRISGNIGQVNRKACLDLYRRIIERTPIDTGRARANWNIRLRHEDGTTENTDWQRQLNASEFDVTVQDNQVVIYNNLIYIEALEDGHSQQAPAGMVAVSLAEFNEFFRAAIRDMDGIEYE